MTSHPAEAPAIVSVDRVAPAELARVRTVIEDAAHADGVPPLDEAAMLDLESGSYLLATAGEPDVTAESSAALDPDHEPGRLAGFVRLLDGVHSASADLLVDPAYRRRGVGHALLSAALDATAGRELRIWAHGPHPGAARLAAAHRMRPVRELWRMTRPLLGTQAPPLLEPNLPEPSLPPEAGDVRIRTFRPGEDDAGWLRANATAFADHPEQGRMTQADLEERMSQPWFSAAGFFVAERDGRIIGFHWTKVHPDERDEGSPIGEIYVLGVAEPTRGLGTALALTGLRHLAGLGARTAMLFTESDNAPAIGLYRKLGFAHAGSDVMYASPAVRSSSPA